MNHVSSTQEVPAPTDVPRHVAIIMDGNGRWAKNWRRPAEEVALLMQLFQAALSNEVDKLHRNGVRLKVVGDTRRFDRKIRRLIHEGEQLTAANTGLTLTIAANYGGRWDVLQALARLLKDRPLDSEISEVDL